MPTLAEFQDTDSIGIGKFGPNQVRAILAKVRRERLLETPVPRFRGNGIVVAGGGRYTSWAWVTFKLLRELGCGLEGQLWCLTESEVTPAERKRFGALGVEVVNASQRLIEKPHRMLKRYINQRKWTYAGWCLKNYAVELSPWSRVLFMDADCFAADNPEGLFDDPELRGRSLFFSDIAHHRPHDWGFVHCGLTVPATEWESGQKIIDKQSGWHGLRMTNWMMEHADVFFGMVHGDKDVDQLGFRVANSPFHLSLECQWSGWGISQRWRGKEWFRHAMSFKRGEHPAPTERISELFWEYQRA